MRKRCQLCGGKLVKNVCVECGLDNSKSDENYVMGRSGCEELLTHVHTGYEDPQTGKTMTREAQERLKEEIRQRTQDRKNERNLQQSMKKAENEFQTNFGTYQRSAAPPVKQKKKAKGKGAAIGSIIAVLVVVVPLIVNVAETLFDSYSESFWENDDSEWYDDAETFTEYDPYTGVTRELSETGEYYEVSLEAGVYKAGVHIPEGEYYVEPDGGDGSLTLDDDENGIYVTYYFGSYEGAVDSVEGLLVYRGAILEIEDRVSLHFKSENAQMDLTQVPNPNTESKTLSEKFTVGKDIPAGVYDVECIKGSGIFDYEIKQSGEYYSYEGKLIGSGDSSFAQVYRNVVLPEGTYVEIQGMTVTLTPSEYIESEDYNSFYPEY